MLLLSLNVATASDFCQSERACTLDYNPVCSSNGVTYGNICAFHKAQCEEPSITLRAFGSCDAPALGCPQVCLWTYKPVCASNRVTYPNKCEFEKAKCQVPSLALINSEGGCVEALLDDCPAACVAIYDPVCGSDNKTYGNRCELDRQRCLEGPSSTLYMKHEGLCDATAVERKLLGPDCHKACTREYIPVCASNGITYANQCVFHNARCTIEGLTMAYSGPCQK